MTRDVRRSLQTQLLLAVGVLALATVAAVAVASRYGTRQEFRRFQDIERRAVADRVDSLETALARQLDTRCCSAGQIDEVRGQLGPDLVLLVIDDATGRLAGSAGAPLRTLSEVTATREGGELGVEASRAGPGGRADRIALRFRREGTPVRMGDGRPGHLYALPFPSEARDREAAVFLGSLDRRLLGATVVVGLLAIAAVWLLARRTVRPIADLRAAAADLAAGRLDRRVEPSGSREVADLARAFNGMADQLGRQRVLQRNLVTDVAHELRTPLTALQCRLETIQDGLAADPGLAIRQAHDEVLHLARLVTDLQEVALAEGRELRLELREVALADIIRSAGAAAGLDTGARFAIEMPPGLVVRCDPLRARQMVLNLLTNANRHTPVDGTIVVRVERLESEVAVEVTNTGSRLEPAEAERVFDRFYRTDPSRQRVTGGTGLGLAIVKHLAEAQGGRVWARSEGETVSVGFALPA